MSNDETLVFLKLVAMESHLPRTTMRCDYSEI